MSSSSSLIEAVLFNIAPHEHSLILDIGCGYGKWGYLIKIHHKNVNVIGIDISNENLFYAKKSSVYEDLILADACHLPFKDKVVDYSLACEIIEHLNKNDGVNMILEIERITFVKALLTTPNAKWWYSSQSERGAHITNWKPNDLKKKGFKVRGVGSSLKSTNKFTSLFRHFILIPLSYVIPEIGEFILAVKTFKKRKR